MDLTVNLENVTKNYKLYRSNREQIKSILSLFHKNQLLVL